MTICQTSVAPSTMPRMVHTSSSAKVPRNTSREPATLVMPSRTLNDLIFRRSLWRRDGGVGCCGTGESLYCGSEEDDDAEDITGVTLPLQGGDSSCICESAEISIVEWRGGLHFAFFRRKHVVPNFSISHTLNAMPS